MTVQGDIDDYINKLHRQINHLQNVVNSYKKEVKDLRSDYAQMKKERDVLLDDLLGKESTIIESDE